ncbi:30S ribosomal protein S9 [Candidatus Parcubacteria bacterium]|nr:30S ribosomal protein S9 [Candidatus Parcubacteria bacterium]
MAEKTAERYIGATGRRKTSIARVRITPASKFSMEVNGRDFDNYFPVAELRRNITSTFDATELTQKFKVTVKVSGGGISSQSVAISHGVARALEAYDKELRGKLKVKGFLKRDPRAKERRKFGLKKARKAPQWSKR